MYDTIQKTIIAWAFNHYIAYYYFDNVNVNQLKVAFEKGEIELENLPVKRDALKHLKIPWDVTSGVVGKLSIRIPLLTLLTDPWIIRISNLMLVLSPTEKNKDETSTNLDESFKRDYPSTSMEMLQDNSETTFSECQDDASQEPDETALVVHRINSEETKLAEFYSSFSATVSSIVKDIYKNIKLEIESITFLFDKFNHGLAKLSADHLLLHRPDNERKIVMDNVSFYMSSIGSFKWNRQEDLVRFNLNACSLELYDLSNDSNHHSLEIVSETDIYGNIFIVGPGNSSVPVCEFLLEDTRILYFSGEQQQDWSMFARASCSHFNREVSTWESLLKPWPFNLSWDKRGSHKKISLTSDELAEFTMSSSLLDLIDVLIRRISIESMQPKLWPAKIGGNPSQPASQEIDPIFVLHNETGHRLFYAGSEGGNDLISDSSERSKSSSPVEGGDSISHTLRQKLSIGSRSSGDDRDSNASDYIKLTKWNLLENEEIVSFDLMRSLIIRVEGWKTLLPIPLSKTGFFIREAFSDRVKNEDTHIVISVDLEERSARKLISVRSPFNLVNSLDSTLEISFADHDQALYIKPGRNLSVPLPYLFSRIYIRPCNVGVTWSEKALAWDTIKDITAADSKIHICRPITLTDQRHASYCTSKAYRICASVQRLIQQTGPELTSGLPKDIFQIEFLPPMTFVNLLPCEISFIIGDVRGVLSKGSQQKIYHVDTTRTSEVHFEMIGFPKSKAIKIDPGATGSFQYTLEMMDKNHRSLYLNAKIIQVSQGGDPAVQIIISAPYWIINKTNLPLVFKQEGAALEAAGQYREHEDRSVSTLLFSFYETELEPPWLCSMRLGRSKGSSMWCEGFRLEKGSGQRRLSFMPKNNGGDSNLSKSMIDINVRRGYGRYCDTVVVTLSTRYGFDSIAKTPKKAYQNSPQDCKLVYYNYSTNLAQHIGGRSSRRLFKNDSLEVISDLSFQSPGIKITLVDNMHESIVELTMKNMLVKSSTRGKEQIIDCSIQDIRIESALPDCEKNVILDRAPTLDQSLNSESALHLIIDRIIGKSFGTIWFRQVQLSMCELILNIEERLFLKLVEFVSFRNGKRNKNKDTLSRDLDRLLHPEEERMSKYYFDLLRIDLSSLRLSCLTSTNLPSSLQKLKTCLGLKFFGFEDAHVQLSPYFKMNVSQTLRGIFDSITRFYKRQLSEQAPRIVGQQIQNYLRFHLSDLLSSLYDEVYNKLFY